MMRILITGAAGFIGFHLSNALLQSDSMITGVDNLNDYYEVKLKRDRLSLLTQHKNFQFIKADIAARESISEIFRTGHFDTVINLAAQPGVRYSLKHPHSYIDVNIQGFMNVLESCRHNEVKHLIFASSSSIYGTNAKIPFSVRDNVDHPVSLYAATKKANELMAHSYAHLYSLPCTGLRFFTVYGPWGRPDMAYFMFTKAIFNGTAIDVFNHGNMDRDFTYIDDVVGGIVRILKRVPQPNPAWDRINPDPGSSYAPYKLYNIGNNNPVSLLYFIETLETIIGKKVPKNLLPMQPGDVPSTYAEIEDLANDVGFRPSTSIEDGLAKFVDWYKNYYLS